MKHALMIGNSDGIGLAATERLLADEWNIIGISRSESPIKNTNYQHCIADIGDKKYTELLDKLILEHSFDLCIYFAGIGELLDFKNMKNEPNIIDVNLTGMVKAAAAIIPTMVNRGKGHFIGISSVADDLLSAEAPSYNASKAGFSNYLGGLALALKPKGVFVTNVRFGFVDTKMAKGDIRPFMMSVEKAIDHLQICFKKKPASYTAPRIITPLVKLHKLMMKLRGK
ncbi:SDR family NAD(P)-dependent oxidoreductase [Desulfobulbus rhabdoformis]|uniref:SDR family NAD(P)-dependent oxidoreductase n=1 Tax=Desulfobulbus rhabdoformis TaxID=34032 RepID=UPI001963F969|nr:SDR family NAD(P)-dependent oxidoreductase [Desulfobulbus rhabdoformis]MBM9616996.1 SDR family NAD(P)-dependent oxidoreductase [Desulfobulbus rhabdoformis]